MILQEKNDVKLTFAILATLGGGLAALTLWVGIMAGAANTKPEDQAMIKAMLWGTVGGGFVCCAVAIALMIYGRPLTAAAVGGVPVAVFLGVMIYAFLPS